MKMIDAEDYHVTILHNRMNSKVTKVKTSNSRYAEMVDESGSVAVQKIIVISITFLLVIYLNF